MARRFRAVRPERDYVWNKTAPGDVGSDGRQAIDALLANALLPSEHQGSVLRSVSHWLQRMTDLADRKMVAAALAALDAGNATRITNAADTDWIDCQQALHAVGLKVENLLPDWLQARWRQKHPPLRRAKIRGSMPDFFRFPRTPPHRLAGHGRAARRRNAWAAEMGFKTVPRLYAGEVTLDQLRDWVHAHDSQFRQGHLEGIVVRRENADWLENRAKLVRADFTQTIEAHWKSRALEWNRVV